MGWLDEQVAVITGGGSGLGHALAQRFVAEGASVVVLDRSAERVEEVVAELGAAARGVTGDVTAYDTNQAAVDRAVGAFGGLDVFVGNAGLFDYFANVVDTPPDELARGFDELFAVNVKAYLLGVKAALPHLRERRGSVVLTASMGSFHAATGGILYTASKHAVVGLVRELAFELAPEVRVNGVAPGPMLTDIRGPDALGQREQTQSAIPGVGDLIAAALPLGFLPSPTDYTGHYVQLASRSNAAATTGVVVSADGGFAVRRAFG
ncbi:MAG TPA: 3-(cis-5,6-dihydroxycyclohexa-1,3-dien-1-yl)propanoate dehydrogenase [Microthrixaceae bacterium]|nr:3-(cis-5,6-dihydroxycyclohexa-1,3-dien-1-yl)propanoate dehydrogenase [Microthrixaceae bacterium]